MHVWFRATEQKTTANPGRHSGNRITKQDPRAGFHRAHLSESSTALTAVAEMQEFYLQRENPAGSDSSLVVAKPSMPGIQYTDTHTGTHASLSPDEVLKPHPRCCSKFHLGGT